jgi:hypothetical protein
LSYTIVPSLLTELAEILFTTIKKKFIDASNKDNILTISGFKADNKTHIESIKKDIKIKHANQP